jgi:hypothetical protein
VLLGERPIIPANLSFSTPVAWSASRIFMSFKQGEVLESAPKQIFSFAIFPFIYPDPYPYSIL